ncbi:FtsW/RodA/SpoVE family cell cycle protein, partial [Candidatus Microgenomates bacterium]|nr:FtsW/RodA/SpoVE family cell cycle protein [Candidatus Microgenomates bacterium]
GIVLVMEHAQSPTARAFAAGVFLTYLIQVVIHVGMNMGLFPITGLPLPLVSAGGSSLLATMMTLGMVIGARKN